MQTDELIKDIENELNKYRSYKDKLYEQRIQELQKLTKEQQDKLLDILKYVYRNEIKNNINSTDILEIIKGKKETMSIEDCKDCICEEHCTEPNCDNREHYKTYKRYNLMNRLMESVKAAMTYMVNDIELEDDDYLTNKDINQLVLVATTEEFMVVDRDKLHHLNITDRNRFEV